MSEFIDINLEDVEDSFEPMPEGTPGSKIVEAAWKRKEGGDYEYLALTLKPVEGQVEDKHKNKNLWLNLSLHPKALWNMKAFFKGVNMPLNLRNQKKEEIARSLIGRTVRPTVTIEPNKKGVKVNQVGPPYHVFVA